MRIDKNLYRYAAAAVRSYPFDLGRRDVLREFLVARLGHDPEPGRGGVRAAPQDAALDRVYDSGEYRRLSLRVAAIDRLSGLLTSEEMKLLNLVYEQLTWAQIAAVMNVSADNCRGRRWRGIVIKAARLLFGDLA